MVETFTKYLKWVLLAAVVVAGVQFARVYVNRMQLKSIMDSEGLDARRSDTSEEEIWMRIQNRAESTNVDFPEDIDITVEGIGEDAEDLVITARYTDVVDLFVAKVPMEMTVESVAGAPNM